MSSIYTENFVSILDASFYLDTTNQVLIDRTETEKIKFWQGYLVDGTCNDPEYAYDNETINTYAVLFPGASLSMSLDSNILVPEETEVFISSVNYRYGGEDYLVDISVSDFTIPDSTGWEYRLRITSFQSTNGCVSGTGFGGWTAWTQVTSGLSASDIVVNPGESFSNYYTACEVQVGPNFSDQSSVATDEACDSIQG